MLPFDGRIDYTNAARAIAESGFDVTLMLEIHKSAQIDGEAVYKELTDGEFYARAASAARRLADLVDSYKP